MNMYLVAIILGIVEGLTEFLPISSTGHLILVNQFAGFTGRFANMFDVIIQLGAILAVVAYFSQKLFPFGRSKSAAEKENSWDLWKKALIGVFPALIVGAVLGKYIEEKLFNPVTVAIALVIGGIVLIVAEKRKKLCTINSISSLSYKTAFFIGLIQCLAMIPGTSRSAATIIGAMFLGASRIVAAEFSFFLAIPTMLAASTYSFLKAGITLTSDELNVLAIGFITSFFVALLVITVFMNYISKKSFKPFGYYRVILGVGVFIYFTYFISARFI